MKKLSSVWFMWFAFGFGILSVLMMFVPGLHGANARNYAATDVFFGTGVTKGAWPSFIGYMLILLASIGVAIIALPTIEITEKTEKIVLISISGAYVIGIILVMLLKVFYYAVNPDLYADTGYLLAGTYLAGSFALLSLASTIIALVKDW